MGLFNSIKDHFNKAEFTIAPNKKLKKAVPILEALNLGLFEIKLLV